MERALLTQKMMELDSSKSSTQTLQHEVEMAHKQVKVLEQQVRDLQTEAKRLSETISHLRDDKVKLEAELEDQRRRNSSMELVSTCIGVRVGSRASTDRCRKSCPHQVSVAGMSSP